MKAQVVARNRRTEQRTLNPRVRVQVPGGAPVLTWGFINPVLLLMPGLSSFFGRARSVLARGALGAAMLDVDPRHGALANAAAPGMGTGVGSLLSGLLVQYIAAPTHLVYLVLTGVFVLQGVGVVLIRETAARRPGLRAALMPELAVPQGVRGAMLAATPILFAVWALAGFYGSLGPALARQLSGSTSAVAGGLGFFLLAAAGSLTTILLNRTPPRTVMRIGIAVLVLAGAGTLAAVEESSAAGFFLCTVVAGVGLGAGFLGGIRTVSPLAAPHERAGIISVLYVVCYCGMAYPRSSPASSRSTAAGSPAPPATTRSSSSCSPSQHWPDWYRPTVPYVTTDTAIRPPRIRMLPRCLRRNGGFPLVTIEAVSARSGVGKPTIYRYWPNRLAVMIDALAARMASEVPPAAGGWPGGIAPRAPTERSVSLSAHAPFFSSQSGQPDHGGLPVQHACHARGRTPNPRIKRSTLVRNTSLTCNDASRSCYGSTHGTGISSGAGPRPGPRRALLVGLSP
jgi:hypothetical protein